MREKFLHQMEVEYDRRIRASESLYKKISDLMTVSAITMAAFAAIYGYMWSVAEDPQIHLPLISIFALGILTALCAAFNRVELQRTVFLGEKMTNSSEVKEDMMKSWTDASEDDFYEWLIKEYLLCLEQAESAAKKKATKLRVVIWAFSGSCVAFPILFVISLVL